MKKSNFQTRIFATVFMPMNGHTYKLFKNIFNDFLTESKGEINTVLTKLLKKLYFDTTLVEGAKKSCFLIYSSTVFYHHRI